jgi:hypothetical protein
MLPLCCAQLLQQALVLLPLGPHTTVKYEGDAVTDEISFVGIGGAQPLKLSYEKYFRAGTFKGRVELQVVRASDKGDLFAGALLSCTGLKKGRCIPVYMPGIRPPPIPARLSLRRCLPASAPPMATTTSTSAPSCQLVAKQTAKDPKSTKGKVKLCRMRVWGHPSKISNSSGFSPLYDNGLLPQHPIIC